MIDDYGNIATKGVLSTKGMLPDFGRISSILSVIRKYSGILLKPSFGYVWQESIKTTPAVVNDYVGALQSTTGAVTLTQATTSFKPQLLQSGAGNNYLSLDGVNDSLPVTIPNGAWVAGMANINYLTNSNTATNNTIVDYLGNTITLQAGEIGWNGARRVNLSDGIMYNAGLPGIKYYDTNAAGAKLPAPPTVKVNAGDSFAITKGKFGAMAYMPVTPSVSDRDKIDAYVISANTDLYPPNLIRNGYGQLKTAANFSQFLLDTSAVSLGCDASFKSTRKNWSISSIDDGFTPDLSKNLRIYTDLYSGGLTGATHVAGVTQYAFLRFYDGDNLEVRVNMNCPDINTGYLTVYAKTTLAAPLNPGDTQIQVLSSVGMPSVGNVGTIFWPWNAVENRFCYKESSGKVHLPYSYSRVLKSHVYAGPALWLSGGISGNTITLNPARFPSGWDGQALISGTPIAVVSPDHGGEFYYRFFQPVAGKNVIDVTIGAGTLFKGFAYMKLLYYFNPVGETPITISNVRMWQ